jgi:ABC-type molybdate transport system substrate-binding protein
VRLRVAYRLRHFCVSLPSWLNHSAMAAGVVGVAGGSDGQNHRRDCDGRLVVIRSHIGRFRREITALFPGSLKHANTQLIARFERSSGDKVNAIYSTAGAVANKVRNGEAADVAVSSSAAMDQLAKQGKLLGSTIAIVKVGAGAMVRKGMAKPNISTVEHLKAVLLAAKSYFIYRPRPRRPGRNLHWKTYG